MSLTFGVRSSLLSHPVEIEAGSIMLFRQDVAPAGWTKDVASTLNNSALRVMTSDAWSDGKQGATAFDSVFGSGKSSGDVTLSAAQSGVGSHTHKWGGSADRVGTGAFQVAPSTGTTGTNTGVASAAASSPHAHTLAIDLNFVDLILCSKDS